MFKETQTIITIADCLYKSLIIYSIVRFHQMANRKTLIIVPTTSLVEQMYSDFADYDQVDKYCHRIYHGL